MRHTLILLCLLTTYLASTAKDVVDTLMTQQGDKVIVSYNVSTDGDRTVLKWNSEPRIIPTKSLRKACGGDLRRLKAVVFDRVGDFGRVRWKGRAVSSFTVPAGVTFERSGDGYHIIGESGPISFGRKGGAKAAVMLPVYVAVYEKKANYKVLSVTSAPLRVSLDVPARKAAKSQSSSSPSARRGRETEMVEITSTREMEADNSDITGILGSISLVERLLATETELPFSQALQMEIHNLNTMKSRVSDREIVDRINEVLLRYDSKEKELKAAGAAAASMSQAEEKALREQEKQEEEQRRKEAEEEARRQEEKQQKRTIWMIVAGAVVAVLGFVGNGVFRHFRDKNQQKSIMEMQQSLTRQAEHEARRRSGEIVRNKAHQMANKGRNKMREKMRGTGTKAKGKDSKIKSI